MAAGPPAVLEDMPAANLRAAVSAEAYGRSHSPDMATYSQEFVAGPSGSLYEPLPPLTPDNRAKFVGIFARSGPQHGILSGTPLFTIPFVTNSCRMDRMESKANHGSLEASTGDT